MSKISQNNGQGSWEQHSLPGLDPESLTDQDFLAAMKEISGYLDITPGDLKQVYALAYRHAHSRILSTPAGSIMTSPVHFATDDMPVLEVAKLLARKEVAGVPVVGQKEGTVVGVISEKDFMRQMTNRDQTFMGLVAACMETKGCPALKVKGRVASDIMSAPAVTVQPDTPAHAMFDMMRERRINRIPVTEGGRLVGIVSRDDLLQTLSFVPGNDKQAEQQT